MDVVKRNIGAMGGRIDIDSAPGMGTRIGIRLPLFSLHELLRIGGEAPAPEQGIVVILESEGRSFALQVDELVGQQQVVIKSLEQNFRRVEGIAGATIMGDGSVALILDVDALPRLAAREDTADERH